MNANGGCRCADCAQPLEPMSARDLRDATTQRLETVAEFPETT